MPPVQHFILATAGHVDHGKSAIVQALTGIDPDRLPEEKRRGITIDLGFASLTLATPEVEYHLGIIDVPGHEDFVKNMVAGVGSIDLALLIVAADDGWMPQTEEHLHILEYLGVRRGVVALTKSDLVDDVAAATAAVRSRLRGSCLAEAAIVPTAAPSGRGIDELKTALAAELAGTPAPVDVGKPRLPIDRVFSPNGVGTVVTGTLTGGTLARGQMLRVLPSNRPTRVRALQTNHHDVPSAPPGSRVALNLPDLHGIERGAIVTLPDLGTASTVWDVQLQRSARLETNTRPLKQGTRVRVHHGSAAIEARVRLWSGLPLGPGEKGLARLTLATPAAALVGDRFVLRDWPEQHTLAGGTVLDPAPPGGRRRATGDLSTLLDRARQPQSLDVFVTTQLRRDGIVTRAGFGTRTRFATAVLLGCLDQLVAGGLGVRFGDCVVDAAVWERARKMVVELIDNEHAAHPEQRGVQLGEVRAAMATVLPPQSRGLLPLMSGAIADALGREGFVRTATTLGRGGHTARLPARLQPAAQSIRQLLDEKPLEPPSRKELTRTDVAQQAMRFMIASGEAVEIGPEAVLSAAAYAAAVETVRRFLQANGPATVARLKEQLGSSRRIVVPLLEKLDREKITLRQGDLRTAR